MVTNCKICYLYHIGSQCFFFPQLNQVYFFYVVISIKLRVLYMHSQKYKNAKWNSIMVLDLISHGKYPSHSKQNYQTSTQIPDRKMFRSNHCTTWMNFTEVQKKTTFTEKFRT